MKRITGIPGLLALLLFLWSSPAPAQNPRTGIMEVDDLRPGMKGIGLTVFHGTKPEEFDVEILGVMKNNWPGTDMIVAELFHPELDDIGVVQGMSGSPVYVDGKLIGAVAYGWQFSVRPIAGITPIRRMIEVMDLTTEEHQVPPQEWGEGVKYWPEAQAALLQRENPALPVVPVPQTALAQMGIAGMNDPSGFVAFKPLGMPLTVSSNSPLVMQYASTLFNGGNAFPVAAASGGSRLGDPKYAHEEMLPGSAFSVMLVEGDLHIAGTGTATYINGDKMVGFGHPMNGFGAVDAPTAIAEIVSVMPSRQMAFKLGYPVKELGALRQDRLFAVGVSLTAKSSMTPVKFHVVNEKLGVEKDFSYRVWKHRFYLPGLTFLCLLESMQMSSTSDGPLTVEFDYTVTLANGEKVNQQRYYSSEMMTDMLAAQVFATELDALQSNRFKVADIRSIEGNVRLSEQQNIMVLERLVRSKVRAYPGETVKAIAEYARWREGKVEVPVEVRIPEDLQPGEYELHIVDGLRRRELEGSFRPELRRVDDLDDLLEAMKPSFPEDRVYVLLVDKSERLVVQGQRLEDLPGSVAQLIEATARDPQQSFRSQGRLLEEKRIPFGIRVLGSTTVPIKVEER